MNLLGKILLLVLLLQCAITALLYWPKPAAEGGQALHALLQAQDTAVDEIRIADANGNEVRLLRRGEYWLLPELENLPADREQIEQLLAVMASDDLGWPIADSPAARQRFQVSDYLHQRQLTLLAGGQHQATLFLGTSPGFRKVHARNSEQNAIYSIPLNNHDVPGAADGWLDRRLLQTRAPLAIAADGYSLQRQGSEWRLGSGAVPDQRELDALLSALRSLQVDGVASEDNQRELAEVEAELVLAIESLSGQVTLELFQLEGQHFVLSSEFPLFFHLSAYNFDRLIGIDSFMLAEPAAPP